MPVQLIYASCSFESLLSKIRRTRENCMREYFPLELKTIKICCYLCKNSVKLSQTNFEYTSVLEICGTNERGWKTQ